MGVIRPNLLETLESHELHLPPKKKTNQFFWAIPRCFFYVSTLIMEFIMGIDQNL